MLKKMRKRIKDRFDPYIGAVKEDFIAELDAEEMQETWKIRPILLKNARLIKRLTGTNVEISVPTNISGRNTIAVYNFSSGLTGDAKNKNVKRIAKQKGMKLIEEFDTDHYHAMYFE